jgi:hypothetical protein
MNATRNGSPTLALVVYAALGVAIGLVAWAVLVHDGGSSKPHEVRPTLHQGERK